ncbi:hypothetical protein ONR57_12635 [Hoyosella sp. YIM 151337]|uniref:hypothetical protein n=1 Tax=Hoyosella sp. YIM 151337 TaxID=2992742 RepID=UPI00223645AC|nr:hypothetical protein [Hoyosella sp. YIM 151337]MCW4354147.1 hypothetical protein [Hoyosella sp. YIM 151337]
MILISRALGVLTGTARAVLRLIVREAIAAVFDEADLTALISDHIDLDRIATGIDVDAIVARADLNRIVDRLDLGAIIAGVDLEPIVDRVLSEIDLPGLIRESTGSLSSGAVWEVRSQGVRADDAVAGFIGRLLGREARQPPQHAIADEDRS